MLIVMEPELLIAYLHLHEWLNFGFKSAPLLRCVRVLNGTVHLKSNLASQSN